MCINIANEQLQFFFNQHIFQWELDECSGEGVALPSITFTSNAPILDMFLDKGAGLLALLDEESRFPRGSNASLALKLHKGLGSKGGGVYRAPPNKGTSFGVSHYAGYVRICVCASVCASVLSVTSNRHAKSGNDLTYSTS